MADYIPADIVQKLFSQGKSEQEIVAQLRLQGFTPQQINSAINQSIKQVVKGEAPSAPAAPPKPLGLAPEEKFIPSAAEQTAGVPRPRVSAGPQPMPISRRAEPPRQAMPPAQMRPAPPQAPPSMNMQTAEPARGAQMGIPPERISVPPEFKTIISGEPPVMGRTTSEISLEELVEAVVNERWIKFEEKLSIFESREVNLQQQIQELRKKIDELREENKKQESTLVEKIDEFGGNLDKSQARIGSIESAFREFVPTLAENVKSLSVVVGKLKKSS